MKKFYLLASLILVSCSANDVEELQLVYPEEKQISWNDSLSIQSLDYFLYFYSYGCGYCNKLKGPFLQYYYSHDTEIYFVNTEDRMVIHSTTDGLLGVSDINNLFILGTPTLLEIKNNIVSEIYSGIHAIEGFIQTN